MNNQRHTQWVNNAIGMLGGKGADRVVVRVASHRRRLPDAMSWLKERLTSIDGTDAAEGHVMYDLVRNGSRKKR